MENFEQLGLFYLGKQYDLSRQAVEDALVLYDSKDLTTHAVCVGMTGSGKTASFALPILHRVLDKPRGVTRALVLTPTRELAAQVADHFAELATFTDVRVATVFGGVGAAPQEKAFRQGVDVIVGTPGRLLDHFQSGYARPAGLEILVFDEADRMLDMGFLPDVRRIVSMLPAKRQNLMFSASFPDPLRKLAEAMMNDPLRVDVARRTSVAERVSQVVHPVARHRKPALLSFLIRSRKWDRVLVFTRTKRGADRLSRHLFGDGIAAEAIHGDKSQSQRTRVLADFKRARVRVLVATDVAARGLDIDELPHVVNFELPHVPEDYVHRVGRTGRAGREGRAVSLVSTEERPLLRSIERLIQQDIPTEIVFDKDSGAPAAAPERNERRDPRATPPGKHRRFARWSARPRGRGTDRGRRGTRRPLDPTPRQD